ncbi:MAG TPA: 2-oxo-4-hydroxy-4-carboxy-5-ureidoimidazoline decarboxylase [Pseudonocardiaceae bacterium]|jgi:2-oxo-4-hydroxy-4-carboxy-5-ureidoimidazoline decarboxylase
MPVLDDSAATNSADMRRFNGLPADDLRPLLLRCVAVPRWANALVERRPYARFADLLDAASELTAGLTDDEVLLALADHPKIGQRTNSAWSKSEQSGVDDRDAERLLAGNIAYEARFGHIYLVCATGRGSADMLANLTERLANDPVTELGVVRVELGKIAALRLRRVVANE